MALVVDASVALKWFVEEPGSAEARRLWRQTPDLAAPDILVAEVCNAAWKKVRRAELVPAHATAIARRLARGVLTYSRSEALAGRATAIALELDHPVYDCLYLALAEAQASVVVTADRRLTTRLEGSSWSGLVRALENE